MSRLNRRRFGARLEFRFSGLRAIQVPVVSDRLLLSIISVDTGKTIAKSSKAAARNGICQWPDSILESIWFSQDEASKEYEDYQCRIAVSMGSTRGVIVGEVFINLTNYLGLEDSTAISLPLKKCNSETVLQLNIQCLGRKSKSRRFIFLLYFSLYAGMELRNGSSPHFVGHSPSNDDMDNKSDGSNNLITRNAHFPSKNHLDGFREDEVGIKDTNFSQSPRNDSDGGLYIESSQTPGRNMLQESIDESSLSGFAHLSSGASGSSKDLLDAAEETIEELLGEAQMWESHSQKLKNDLETLQKECDEKSKKQSEILLELSTSQAEQKSLRQEIKELKLSLEVANAQQMVPGTPKSGDAIDVHLELKDEVQFLRESNENLTTQLKKSQDANIELVSILQELEETIEAQRMEISNFAQMSNMIDHEVPMNALSVQEDAEWERKMSLKEDEIIALREKLDRVLSIENAGGASSDAIYLELEKENDFLKVKIQELENDCSELTEENLELLHKLKEVSGVEGQDSCISDIQEMLNAVDLSGTSKSRAKYLERKCADLELRMLNFQSESTELEEKLNKSQEELKERTLELSELRENLSSFHEIDVAKGYQLRSEGLGDTESELNLLKGTIQLKEKEIEGLQHSKLEMESEFESELNLLKGTIQLKEKEIEGLQHSKLEIESKFESELNLLKGTIQLKEKETEGLHHSKLEIESELNLLKGTIQLKEKEIAGLQHSKLEIESELNLLKGTILLKEKEIEGLQHSKLEIESELNLLKGTIQLKEKEIEGLQHSKLEIESELKGTIQLKEKDIEGLQHSKLEMETFIDNVLRQKIHELEVCKVELESHIFRLEDEKLELLESISGMEVELTNLTCEYESCIVQMDDSRTMIIDLKDKVEWQQSELEAQKVEMKQKQEEFQKRFSEVQEDSEALRRLNAKLQAKSLRSKKKLRAKVDNLIEDYNSLQALTDDLKKEKLELHGCATQLEQELEHSKRKTTDFCRTVEFLEVKLSSIQKDISSKEQTFLLELENIFHEHKQHEEKINRAHFLLNKIDKEKAIEVENLEREVMSLTAQLSSTHEEQESSMLDTIREASTLRADKAKLQANLHDVNEQLRHYESQLEDIHKEYKSKIKSLTDSLNALKQNEEMLKTDVKDMRRLMEATKSNEENLRITSNELELKYKSSDYEKQQIMEENSGLKIQIQKIACVQDELLKAQSSLDEAKFEKGRLQELLRLMSEECDELKVQKAMLTDKVSHTQGTSNKINGEKQSKTSKQGNNDLATDNGGCSPVNEEPDLQARIQSLESRLAEALEENSMYRTQVKSEEGQSGSGEGNHDDKIAQLESELKDMQDRLLNVSLQYAEVEAQREELVMELKNVNAKKGGRWF